MCDRAVPGTLELWRQFKVMPGAHSLAGALVTIFLFELFKHGRKKEINSRWIFPASFIGGYMKFGGGGGRENPEKKV